MDSKRIILATVLSLLVLLTWGYFFPPATPKTPQGNHPTPTSTVNQVQQTPSTPQEAQQPNTVRFTPNYGENITVDTPLYRAVLNQAGAVLQSFELKGYKETIEPGSRDINLVTETSVQKAPLGLIWNTTPTWSAKTWTVQGGDMTLSEGQSGTLTLMGTVAGIRITRALTFTGGTYEIKEEVKIDNISKAQTRGTLAFSVSSVPLSAESDKYNHTKVAYMADGTLHEEDSQKDLEKGLAPQEPAQWAGVESNYFLMAIVPTSSDMKPRAKFEDAIYRMTMADDMLLDPGVTQIRTCSYYFGPKTEKALASMPKNLKASINYGFFDVIAKPLNTFLNFLYGYVGNYGIAIIILTVCIKALFWPLSQKSYKSMEQMKRLQPLMTKIREQHADDREKMNAEIMQLYKTHKVNPAGGCLPMLLQIPVFFALYQALLGAIDLRHAAFIPTLPFTDIVWLADLSAKDPFYITPLIMGATMFLQQRLSPPMGDPTQAKIMMFMPVIFTFLFLNFPAGLVVYWLVNNVLSIAQQWFMIRKAK